MLATLIKVGIGAAVVFVGYKVYEAYVEHHPGTAPQFPESCA